MSWDGLPGGTEVDLIKTGSGELDMILGGGILSGSLVLLAGAPGTGKTVLAQQICFTNATPERPAIFYTTLSEPHSKLIRHLDAFSFFDGNALGGRVQFQHLAGIAQVDSLEAISDEIVRKAFAASPSVVVVDSAKALHEASGSEHYRRVVYEMASRVAHTDAVLILVGEYAPEEIGRAVDFAVADVIIALANEPAGVFDERWLRVLKVRGSDYLAGRHPYRVTSEGITVHPRLESTPAAAAEHLSGRLSTGVPGLDQMAGGGFPRGGVTLISGPSGAGKTVACLHFVADGIARGERSLVLSFQESRAQLAAKAASFGWDLEAGISSDTVRILEMHPVELGLDALAAEVRAALTTFGPQRAVVEGLGDLSHAARESDRFPDFMWSFLRLFRAAGATTILTSETTEFFGPTFDLARGLSFMVDNAILLRYTELESEIRRALSVVKMRESDHVKSLVEFEIGPHGIQVKSKFAGVTGVLSGTPVHTEEKFREFFGR